MSDQIPLYPLPKELVNVLDKNLKKYPGILRTPQKYIKILRTLQNVKSFDIVKDHYLQLLKLALYLEEYQNNKEMKKYHMFEKPIEMLNPKSDPLFRVAVDHLDEERPWVKPNDIIDVIDVKDKRLYTLRITNVTLTNIVAYDEERRLLTRHKPERRYDITFRLCNYPLRCAHYALELMAEKNTVKYLFPDESKNLIVDEGSDEDDDSSDDDTYTRPSVFEYKAINPNIAGNAEQQQAVLHIVNKSSFPAPYILYGPPGTGKTATLVEAMCQIHENSSGKILVCTPSNTAGDEITRRLLEFLPSDSIYRLYSQSKDGSTVDEQIQLCSNFKEKTIVLPSYVVVIIKRIVITTLCTATRLITMNISHNHFSHVFIDEAGQGLEPDILIPITLVSEYGRLYSQIVFAGDPQQLGPTVVSKLANCILGRSILERLMSYDLYKKDSENKYNPKYITKLLQNYRSHPDILHVSNRLFYENELIAKCPRSSGKHSAFLCPIIFHGIEGKEEKFPYSPSVSNWTEVRLVVDYVEKLLRNRLGFGAVTANDIGIITPFTLQSKKIKRTLNDRGLKDINVGTVELFQGQEREVMIMTTVRSKTFVHEGKEHIGFLSNPKRFNVAITRAKKLLIIVGNPKVLQVDENWHCLLKFCIDKKAYQGLKFSLNSFNDKKDVLSSGLIKSSVLFKNRSSLLSSEQSTLNDLLSDLHIMD